jgi:hypothetical protein
MLFRETVAVYFKNHTEHTNTLLSYLTGNILRHRYTDQLVNVDQMREDEMEKGHVARIGET